MRSAIHDQFGDPTSVLVVGDSPVAEPPRRSADPHAAGTDPRNGARFTQLGVGIRRGVAAAARARAPCADAELVHTGIVRARRTLHVARGPEVIEARLGGMQRSEEHTSELQSLMRISYAVFCLKK